MTATAKSPVNLFGLDRTALRARFAEMGEAPYRADQVMNWIYRRGVDDFALMTNLGKDLRARLASVFVIQPPELITEQVSADGTRKWVTKAGEGQAIETVFIPEDDRGTLCISSQVGCAMDCSFCATGAQGFSRNLSTAEIIAQVWFASKTLGGDFQTNPVISNVVFMGMGEPLANFDNVWGAVRRLHDDLGLSARHLTVSTVGVVPGILRLAEAGLPVNLAVSLHAANDALRDELVPLNRRYPLAALAAACATYVDRTRRRLSIEWALIDRVNDRPSDVEELAAFARPLRAHVNLIPLNPTPGYGMPGTPAGRVQRFRADLERHGVRTTVRDTRGVEIDAACVQLAGRT